MSNAPRFDSPTNDRDHVTSCNCGDCMPPGADGALEDALEAARVEMVRSGGIRGVYRVRPLAKTTAVSWSSDGGSRTDITREALRAAARHLTARGRPTALALGMTDLYVAA